MSKRRAIEPTDFHPATTRVDMLMRITHAIETAATLDELAFLSLHELTRFLRISYGHVALLNVEASTLQVLCEYPPQVQRPPPLPITDLPWLQELTRTRQLVQLHDGQANHLSPASWRMLQVRDVRSALLVPLIVQDHVIGIVTLAASEEPRTFTTDELALTRILVGQVAAAIAAVQMHESAERRNNELNTLNDIASTITSTLDTREVYRLVVQKLSTYFNVEAGSLLLLDEVTGEFEFVMTIEGGEEKLAGVRVPSGRGIVGRVAQTRHWEIVPDVQSDPRVYRKVSEDVGFVVRSILCVPMIAKGRMIGAIELLNKHDGEFTNDEAERLTRMGAFIGVAIENARLFQQVSNGRDRLAAILNATADGILMTDMNSVILTANPAAAQLFETSEAQLIGQSLDTVLRELHGRAHEVIPRPWGGENGGDHDSYTPVPVSEMTLSGSTQRFIRHLRVPVRDARGEVYGQLALFRDVTQEKELEQLREDYTSMLVHDLRAPLTSIMNGVMMVQRGLGGPVTTQQQEMLKIAHQGSQAMLELINTLLDISKMEEGRMTLELKPLAPYALVDQVIERLQVSAAAQEVRLEQMLAPGLPLVEADEDKIVRVLQNLLDNAIKFSQPRSTVTLGAHVFSPPAPLSPELELHPPMQSGAWLIFWVRDRGPGIPAAYHERIFEKFGQVRGRKVRGTGLGLTFCKLAVEAHNGHIWLESEEGAGSLFAFALPLA